MLDGWKLTLTRKVLLDTLLQRSMERREPVVQASKDGRRWNSTSSSRQATGLKDTPSTKKQGKFLALRKLQPRCRVKND